MVSQVVDNAGGPGGNRTHIRGFAVPDSGKKPMDSMLRNPGEQRL